MVSVSVTVDDEHLARIDDVAAELRANGMQVDRVLDQLGVISGSVPEDRQQSLRAVAGVQSVEASRHFQQPPPDAPVQ
jgi:ligand-binding sensor domain-containing protein